MKFSIITCTWNSIATLPETVRSVQSQSYSIREHIFVDGGSTDGTLEYIAQNCPGAIVLTGITGGISRALNHGLAAASGDIIGCLHSDDYYTHPRVLAFVAEIFSRDGCQWLVGRTDDLRNGIVEPGPVLGKFSRRKFRSRNFYCPHPSTFMTRALMQQVGGFDEKIRYALDINYWLRAMRVAEPVIVEESLAVFREHQGSLSSSNRHATVKDEWAVRTRYARDDLLAAPLMHCRMIKQMLTTSKSSPFPEDAAP